MIYKEFKDELQKLDPSLTDEQELNDYYTDFVETKRVAGDWFDIQFYYDEFIIGDESEF